MNKFDQLNTLNGLDEDRVAALDARREELHDRYSQAFFQREEAERQLGAAFKKRAALANRSSDTAGRLADVKGRALRAAIDGQDLTRFVEETAALSAEEQLLKGALYYFDVFDSADASRMVLVAAVSEKEAQYAFEIARKEHHQAKTIAPLSAAAEFNGSIQVESGTGIAADLEKICNQIATELTETRRALRVHDEKTAAMRSSDTGGK